MNRLEKLQQWLLYTPVGRYVLRNERVLFQQSVSNIFGYYSLQLGMKQINFLQWNKIPNHYIIDGDIMAKFELLPISCSSIDLIVCPHILDFSDNYQSILNECYRVLSPNGTLIISGFNKNSLFTFFGKKQEVLNDANIVSLDTLKSTLIAQNFTISRGSFFCYAPPINNNATITKMSWLEKVGNRWFPTLSNNYFLIVKKNVVTPTLIPDFKKSKKNSDELSLGTVTACNKNTQ
jgi:SAM-dependent methyltransferase